MRDSLKQSLAESPAGEFDRFPKGSIVLCNACAKPIFRLDHGISLGDKAGKMVTAFKPLRMADLDALGQRRDIDAGVRAMVLAMTPEAKALHVAALKEMRTGDPMVCPCCDGCFVQVLSVEAHEVLDKAYTIELLTIPPEGQKAVDVRGKQIGYYKDWVH